MNDGGVAITNYLIFVNMSQQVVSTSTNTTLTLNSTGKYVIEISAVNGCGLRSAKVSIKITGIHNYKYGHNHELCFCIRASLNG